MTLLQLSHEEIVDYVNKLESEVRALKADLIRLCWFMRGGITISEIYAMDSTDRVLIGEMVKENMDIVKETGVPFF